MEPGVEDDLTEDNLVKAARELLRWDQLRLAEAAGVGVASVRRFETGVKISHALAAKLFNALEAAGILFMRADAQVGDVQVKTGVALMPWAVPEPPPEARRIYPPRKKRTKPTK